jgi:RIO kinase 1
MLCCDLVHGDLSPYNVLLAWDGPVIIDFPQVVGAAHNSLAEGFFFRDLANLRRFFEGLDPALRAAAGDGREIWRAYTRRELTPDFVPPPPRPGALPAVDPRELPPGQRAPTPQRQAQPPPQQRQSQPARPARPSQRPAEPPHGGQSQRPPGPQPHQGRRPQPPQPQRRQGSAQQPPRGPVVERRPVLGAPVAPESGQPPAAGGPAPSPPGQGRRRRRRRRHGGGGGGGGGGAV